MTDRSCGASSMMLRDALRKCAIVRTAVEVMLKVMLDAGLRVFSAITAALFVNTDSTAYSIAFEFVLPGVIRSRTVIRRCGSARSGARSGATSDVPTDVVAPQVPV